MSHPAPNSNRKRIHPTPLVTPTKQTKAPQISNRESLRLEIDVTPTKQRPDLDSNRELEACFYGPSRGGCFSPPAVRPRLRRRVPPAEPQIHPAPNHQNSNRESLRLETHATTTKQRPDYCSNRELEALLSAPSSPLNTPALRQSNHRRTGDRKPSIHGSSPSGMAAGILVALGGQ